MYIPDVLALPVVQQPAGDAGYVSDHDNEATQFAMASQYGNIGLLAHNYLSGRLFSRLAIGEEVRLVYGDGKLMVNDYPSDSLRLEYICKSVACCLTSLLYAKLAHSKQ